MEIYDSKIITLNQQYSVYSTAIEIIENLDESAISELMSSYGSDFEKMLDMLCEQINNVLNFKGGKIQTSSFGYLERFTEQVDEELACRYLNYFIVTKIPEFEIGWHHLEWGNFVQLYKYLCVEAARDHGKSYFFSFAYLIWKMYRYKKPGFGGTTEYSLSKQGILITNEFNLAKHLLGLIKDEIENNDLLREKLFPNRRDGWAETEIVAKNGSQLIVKSYGSKMRGFHPGYIVADDFLNDSVLYSEEQRTKYITMFHSVIMNMIVPKGQVIVAGTPYHQADLYADLKSKPRWKVFEYPAIFPDGSILWENRHSLESILEKKQTQGSIIFSREILVRPISSDSTIFPYHILEKAFIGMDTVCLTPNVWSHTKKFKKVVTGCDFAMSANVGADYSVFITLGIDELDNYWLLNMYREKGMSYNQQIAVIKVIHQNFKPEIIMMENNQAQVLFAQLGRDANLPIVEHNTGKNKYDLKDGYPGMSVLFELGKIKFPRGDAKSKDVTDTICMELSSVTWSEKGKLEGVGSHDDTCASLWIALRACNYVNQSFSFSFI